MIKVIDARCGRPLNNGRGGEKVGFAAKSIHDQLSDDVNEEMALYLQVMRRTLLVALGFSLSLFANIEVSPSFVKSADTGRYCCNRKDGKFLCQELQTYP